MEEDEGSSMLQDDEILVEQVERIMPHHHEILAALETRFAKGEKFTSDAELDRIMQDYCKGIGFTLKMKVYKKKYIRYSCSRGGNLLTNKNNGETKKRNRLSLKCGCCFSVNGKYVEDSQVLIQSRTLEHCGGCKPSTEQLRVSRRAAGLPIPCRILTGLVALVKARAKTAQIRSWIQENNLGLVYRLTGRA